MFIVVLVQAVLTPAAHVEAAAHGEHGVFPSTYPFPEEDQVEPATQGTAAGQVAEAQNVPYLSLPPVKAELDFQVSAIWRLLQEVRDCR